MKRAQFVRTGIVASAAALLPWRASADARLAERVRHLIAQRPQGRFGVVARTMAPGPPLYAVDAHERFPCASTIKVLIAATAFFEEERKPGTLRERIAFDPSRRIGGSDYMQGVAGGTRLSVGDLMVPMIELSDNTAANMLIEHFGVARINEVGRLGGMLRTRLARPFIDAAATIRHEPNVTTPRDMAELLFRIETSAREDERTILTPSHSRSLIALMLRQRDRDKIPAGLRGVAVADKDGEIDGTRNDVAIVEPYGDSPFVLSICTKQVQDYDACLATIRRIAHLTYESVAGSDL